MNTDLSTNGSGKTVNIVIADSHPLIRLGLMNFFCGHDQINIAAEASDGHEVLELIRNLLPDAALLSIRLRGISGFEIVRRLCEENIPTEVIFLADDDSPDAFFEAIDLGVKGYVLKTDPPHEISDAVYAVIQDKYFISPALSGLVAQVSRDNHHENSAHHLLASLTQTQKQILRLTAELFSNQEIADRMFISKRTIENHRVEIAHKLQLACARQLLRYALRYKDKL